MFGLGCQVWSCLVGFRSVMLRLSGLVVLGLVAFSFVMAVMSSQVVICSVKLG